jgi:hypothetical protein
MRDAAIRHVGDVQQAVQAAQIDEGAVFGQVLDHAGDDGAFLQLIERGALALVDLLFHGQLARDHHVAAAPVQLDDLDRNILAANESR